MRTLLLVLILFGFSAPTLAQETLVITKAGYFLLTQDADGNPSLVKIARIIKLDEPPDPTDPTDPPTDQFRAAVQAATSAVVDPNKANTKIALSKLYRTTSQLPVQNPDQLREATAVIFNALELPAAWAAWKKAVDAAAASFAADVDRTKAAYVTIAEVLEAQ